MIPHFSFFPNPRAKGQPFYRHACTKRIAKAERVRFYALDDRFYDATGIDAVETIIDMIAREKHLLGK